ILGTIFTGSPNMEEQARKFDEDLEGLPGGTVYRLREGIERFLITDINNPAASAEAQSNIVVMYDQITTNVPDYNHIPGGGNSLYMDGHVDFLRYPSEYPFCTSFAWLNGYVPTLL
ncbi:MAG: hypothetical protein IT368_01360, partial [Candidatus Hydrogenedentes bacterium]|nr:hypothetical protein [Candidatus Hydrogenedentota bacterium]